MNQLETLMQQNFLEYASYVIVDRAIPDLRDGCKPVQRRILYTLFAAEDGKFHKVANIIGETMKLHPHGDASIGDALVVLANKEYFIEKQGNYGSILTGHRAAASRYIECRLTPLAHDTLFNPHLTTWQNSYDGRREEPVFLPAKLPVVLMLGCEGIAVGMATKILPHNFGELLRAQIQILNNQPHVCYPDFPQGGSIDISNYNDGRGKLRNRATLEPVGDKKIVIREIPYSTTTESLIESIESAIQKGKVKISSINDFTTDKVEIELVLARGIYADEVIPQLYAYTDCEVSISSNVVLIDDRHPREMTVGAVLQQLTERLREQIKAELNHELEELLNRQHQLTLEEIFIENKVYKQLETAKNQDDVMKKVRAGMQPFISSLTRVISDVDLGKLLDLKIRRISSFDREKNRFHLEEVQKSLKSCRIRLKNLTQTTIDYINALLKKYEHTYPRRTALKTFEEIDPKKIARQNLKVSFDAESGYFGTDVRGQSFALQMSEYDLALVITRAGAFRALSAEKKVWLGELLYAAIFEPSVGLELLTVYQDNQQHGFVKKLHLQKILRNKEYRLVPTNCKIVAVWPFIKATRLEFSWSKKKKNPTASILVKDIPLTPAGKRGTLLGTGQLTQVLADGQPMC